MQIHTFKVRAPAAKIAVFIGTILGYFILGLLALKLATVNHNTSPIWPAAGLALGSILLFGNWLVPAIFLGAFITNLSVETPLLTSFVISLGNTLEAIIAASLIRKFNRKDLLLSYSEVISLLLSAFIGAAVASSISTIVLSLAKIIGPQNVFDSWYTWWSGDITGILMVTPLYLAFTQPNTFSKINRYTFLYAFLITATILLIIYSVFVKEINQAYIWILTPIFTLAGIKVSSIFSRVLLIIASTYAIILTALGHGPFEFGNINRNLLYVQMLIASYSIAVLFSSPLKTKYKIRPQFFVGILTGWIALFTVIYFSSNFEKKQTMNDFRETVNSSLSNLQNLARQYELLLEGQGTAFSVWNELNEERWNRYIKASHVKDLTDILNSIGFIKVMNQTEAQLFSRKSSIPIRTLEEDFAKLQKNKYIVIHNEPFKTRSAKGWDLGSEPIRRAAADEAFRLKSIVITDPLNLRRDSERKDGLLIFHPVFRIDGEFLGWNYVSALNQTFYGKVFTPNSYLLNVKVSANNQLIFTNAENLPSSQENSPYAIKENIELFNKKFEIDFYPTDFFFSRHSGYSAQMALLLNIFILFITGFFLQQLTFGQRAEELVQKRTEELEFSKAQLVHSSKMASLGEMASGMAHEINNPLTIIQGKIQVINMLMEDLHLKDPMLLSEFNKIKITTDRIGKIVKGLRNFSRVAENDPFEMILLDKLLHETLDLCAERFKSDGINLQIDPIPEILIKCRPGEISQVLINLLNNSSDAVQKLDEKWIKVKFQKESSKRLVISITDSGRGISQKIADKVMDPFFTTKEVGKGTGLGLSISRGIIEAHGGSLKIDSHSTHTRFLFDLEYREV